MNLTILSSKKVLMHILKRLKKITVVLQHQSFCTQPHSIFYCMYSEPLCYRTIENHKYVTHQCRIKRHSWKFFTYKLWVAGSRKYNLEWTSTLFTIKKSYPMPSAKYYQMTTIHILLLNQIFLGRWCHFIKLLIRNFWNLSSLWETCYREVKRNLSKCSKMKPPLQVANNCSKSLASTMNLLEFLNHNCYILHQLVKQLFC